MKKGMRCSALLLLLLACSTPALWAEETPLNEDGLRALIKDLGSDDFEKRQGAEKKLAAQGVKAEALLKATVETTTDAQVRATAARLLGKLKLAGLGSVDYLSVFPANCVLYMQLRNITESVENGKGTALGKLLLSPEMEPFRKKVEAAMNEKPEQRKVFELWEKRFSGQFGVALWQFSAMPDQMRLAVIGQITDPNPQAVFDEFMAETGLVQMAQKLENYRDVDIYGNPQGAGGVVALAGPNIIFSVNRDSVKTIIDNLLKPGGLQASPEFSKLRATIGEKPELVFGMDYEAYMKQLFAMLEIMGQAEQAKAMQKAMGGMGVEMKHFVMATRAKGAHYEDRMLVTMSGDPKGLIAASVVPEGAPAPLEDMAIVPGNAVAAGVGYLDGKALQQGARDYLNAMVEMLAAQQKDLPPEFKKGQPDLGVMLKTFAEKTGVKAEDLLAGTKGSFGYYAVLAPGGVLEAPELGLFITFADNAAAQAFSDAAKKGLDNVGPVAVVREIEAPNNRKLLQIDLKGLGATLPDKFPYAPVWVVEGNRVFMASSVGALRKQLSYMDTKTPGLLTQPDFVKAMGLMSPAERRGGVMYINMKNLMSLGATVALPFIQAGIPDEGLKAALAALPAPAELFKDIPPLLGSTVVKGPSQESVLRGPIPPLPSAVILGIGAAVFGVRAMQPMGGVAPEAPGGF